MNIKISESLSLMGKGLAYENVTKAKTNSAGRNLLRLQKHQGRLENNVLLAADELDKCADELLRSHTVGGEWDGTEPEAEAEHERLSSLAADLRAGIEPSVYA